VIRPLASFDTVLVFSRSNPGSLDAGGGLNAVEVDDSLDIACSLDAAGSLAGPLDVASSVAGPLDVVDSLAGSLVVAGSLDGVGSLEDTGGLITGDAESEAAEEDAAKLPEVNAVERVASIDCSAP